jgi:hypothetical protein
MVKFFFVEESNGPAYSAAKKKFCNHLCSCHLLVKSSIISRRRNYEILGRSLYLRRHDIQHNDIQHDDTQHKNTPYRVQSECRNAECRDLLCVTLNVNMLNVVAPFKMLYCSES